MKQYKTESKLSLILCVLGFLNVTLLSYLGLLIGLFLSAMGLYIAEDKVRKYTKKDELANIAIYFGMITFIFTGLIGLMYGYFVLFIY